MSQVGKLMKICTRRVVVAVTTDTDMLLELVCRRGKFGEGCRDSSVSNVLATHA